MANMTLIFDNQIIIPLNTRDNPCIYDTDHAISELVTRQGGKKVVLVTAVKRRPSHRSQAIRSPGMGHWRVFWELWMLAEASDSGWCAAGWQSVWRDEWGIESWDVKNCTRTPSCRGVSEEDRDFQFSWKMKLASWLGREQAKTRTSKPNGEWGFLVEWNPDLGAMSTKILGMYWSEMLWLQLI